VDGLLLGLEEDIFEMTSFEENNVGDVEGKGNVKLVGIMVGLVDGISEG